MEIKGARFAIEARRLIEESISGSVAAKERPGFVKLIDRMESGDVLVVTKLDRLGRNAMDVRATVEQLASAGVRVHCLALGGVDLTSPAGKMTMQVIAAVAEFERDLLIERTQSGIVRAKAAGKPLGRNRTRGVDGVFWQKRRFWRLSCAMRPQTRRSEAFWHGENRACSRGDSIAARIAPPRAIFHAPTLGFMARRTFKAVPPSNPVKVVEVGCIIRKPRHKLSVVARVITPRFRRPPL